MRSLLRRSFASFLSATALGVALLLAALLSAAPAQAQQQDAPDRARQQRMERLREQGEAERRERVEARQRALQASQARREELSFLGRWSEGRCQVVAARGQIAYCGGEENLHIVDFSSPSDPVKVGQETLPATAEGVTVEEEYVYVATSAEGLRVIDASTPSAPQEIGALTSAASQSVSAAGDYAYVASGELKVIDVSDPANPQEFGTTDTGGIAENVVAATGEYAYVTADFDGFRIIDVSNPSSPQEVGFVDLVAGRTEVAAVEDEYAYIPDGQGGLIGGVHIVDVSDPSDLEEIGVFDPDGVVKEITVVGDYAYMVSGGIGSEIRVVDVSEPDEPNALGTYSADEAPSDLAATDSYAYVADGTRGLYALEHSGSGGGETGGVVEQDSLALVALYNAADGENWNDNSGWLEAPVKDWYGVTVVDNRVAALILIGNQLSGQIPEEIDQLDALENLFLGGNQLSGQIPSGIGQLGEMTILNLVSNNFSGEVPAELGQLTNLINLALSENELSGGIPASFTNLSAMADASVGSFFFNDTNLCEPPDADFQEWLDRIEEVGSTNEICSDESGGSVVLNIESPSSQVYEVNMTTTYPGLGEQSDIVIPATSIGTDVTTFRFDESALGILAEDPLGNLSTKSIELEDANGNLIGHLPFEYTVDDVQDARRVEATLFVHDEEALRLPEIVYDGYEDWDYYESSDEKPVSMLIPPGEDRDAIDTSNDPLLFVHGLYGAYPTWRGNTLLEDESDRYDAWQFYYPHDQFVENNSPLLSKALQWLAEKHYGGRPVDIVAHSMGGLVTRHYLQSGASDALRYEDELRDLEYDPQDPTVRKVLMLGTPNHGSYLAYRAFYNGRVGVLSQFFTDRGVATLDDASPANRQMTPGSHFLYKLDASAPRALAGSGGTASEYLVLAGTADPPLSAGLPHNEIQGQDDGLVAVSSASMLGEGIPLATTALPHTRNGGSNLKQETGEIARRFLQDGYDPANPALGADIDNFWRAENDRIQGPPGTSFDADQGILTLRLPGARADELAFYRPCELSVSQCGSARELVVRPQVLSERELKRISGASNYFSRQESTTPLIVPDEIGVGLPEGSYSARLQQITLIGTWAPFASINLSVDHVATAMQSATLSEGALGILNSGVFLPGEGEGATATPLASAAVSGTHPGRASASIRAAPNPSTYYVDAQADSVVFWLTGFNDGSAPDPQLRLTSPSGTRLTPSAAQGRADADYQEDRSAGFAYYYLEDPETGLWTVSYDERLSQATLSVPAAGGEIGLDVAIPDTARTVGDEVSTRIVGPSPESCTDTQVQASVLYRQEPENPLSAFGPIALSQNGNAYEGSFTARQSGTYFVSTELTCDGGERQVRRQVIRPVPIGGGSASTNTPATPADLSATPRSEGQTTLSWQANTEGDLRAYLLYRSTRSESETLLDTLSAGTTTYSDENLSEGQSYFYRLKALDAAGNESDFSDTAIVRAAVLNISVRQSFGNAEEPSNYRLVALPGASNTPVASTLDGERDDWRVFYDNGQSGSRDDYLIEHSDSDRFNFAPGRGFWMLSENAWQSSGETETVSLSENGTHAIILHEGWNIVSNPFGVDVDWSAVQEANGVTQALWRWNGNYQEVSSFASAQSGQAYYFFNEQGFDELALPYPTGGDASSPAAQTQDAETKPSALTVRASTEGDSLASSVAVGQAKGAKDGFDARDQYAPPGAFASTRLHLAAPFEAESGHDRLVAEYRPADGDGQRFEVVLETSEANPLVTLSASGLDAFADQQVVLIDQRTLRRYDLHEQRAVRVQPQGETTGFALLVGSAAFVEQEAEQIAPEESQLLGNYPNPFRARTTIAYTVAEPSDVRLVLYDMLGRQVRTLVNEKQEPGREEVGLDARGLSSGVYVYRLKVGDYTETGKVVLVR